jgi:hypothetical protein
MGPCNALFIFGVDDKGNQVIEPVGSMKATIVSVLRLAAVTATGQTATCRNFSAQDHPVFWDPSNRSGHKPGGYHSWTSTLTGSCA